jgi:hypothetical protein
MRCARAVGFGLLAALPACETGSVGHGAPATAPGPEASADVIAGHLALRVGEGRSIAKLDVRGSRVLVGLSPPAGPRAETDERPGFELAIWQTTSDELHLVRSNVRAAALGHDAVFAVTTSNVLVRVDPLGSETRLLERAQGKPAVLADGSVAVARAGDEPGETDIWLAVAGGEARPLAEGPGPDDLPIALPDGRIAFVSGRSGIASLFIADPNGGALFQLTNRGLSPGMPLAGFVPPPLEVLAVSATEIRYDAGDGERWSVTLATGFATPIGGSGR